MWLQTSPEFAMKRLLAAGGQALYQVTRAFRGGETGPLHNPEFTIVEWYRRGDTMAAGIQTLSELCAELLNLSPAEAISYRQAFETHASVDPHHATTDDLRAAARRLGIAVADSFDGADRDNWLNLLLAEIVQPRLGLERPAILYDYPASQAALAQVRGDPAVAERFELFVRGVELANGYHELLDADVLRQRTNLTNRQRAAEGRPALPESSRLLAAMEHGLPDCTGVALGFDRVVMLAAGAASVADVMAFPIDRA
jgi:lysyl-tRNA synthetase class 2